ncbi:MAG: magnesium/cobalt transporter CorA [Paludibacteraceae bacterium]|nr:magnesium/cobalt transporter CorA [Paludibacteraceae bacterium]MBP6284373.1 magnesium/cobalt transporter CorA [Paludibacteraceae bacterium]
MKTIRKGRVLSRKQTDPNSFIFTGDKTNETVDMQLFSYSKDTLIECSPISLKEILPFEKSDSMNWLNIHGLNNVPLIERICKTQGIHNLVIQDILDVNQRPKFQEYDGYSFVTIKSIVPSTDEMITEQISFVIGKNYIISFQERKGDYFEHLRIRLRNNAGILRERGADYLLYAMLESILDTYFKTLQQMETDVDKLNLFTMNEGVPPSVLESIEMNKKFVHFIKKAILPIKEFSLTAERNDNQFIEPRHIKYFLEIKDICLTLLDNCDILLTTLESNTNLYFSVQGHQMNQIMKTLTIVATIFIPLTFIAGVYGMNFRYMPELGWKYGYLGVWGIMLLALGGMLYFFKKKKWL